MTMSPARRAQIRAFHTGWNHLALDADRIDATFAVVAELLDEVERLNAAADAALRVIDDGPQMVSDRVEEHWSVVACRAADVLRKATSLPAAEDGE